MHFRKLFPQLVAACFSLSMSVSAVAQKGESRATQDSQLAANTKSVEMGREDEPVIVSIASAEDIKTARIPTTSGTNFDFQNLISAAIDDRLGARYRWGAIGPSAFDCSGFVWSTFQQAGIEFERASARKLWLRFAAPTEEEKFKFGTLVFFSSLSHIGIVADENGFYHASRRHGVIYSTFSDYWLARLDGFRRVPLSTVSGVE